MRKLLFFCTLLLLSTILAKGTLSLGIYPGQKKYVVSLAERSLARSWDGLLTFVAFDELMITLPSRWKVGVGEGFASVGYGGFWQEYALLPFFSDERALLYQRENHALMLFAEREGKQAMGYELSTPRKSISLLAWRATKPEVTSYQATWGSQHARWGVAAKANVQSSVISLHAEAVFSPVKGVEGFVSSSYNLLSSTLGVAYGEAPYPIRYSFSLDLAHMKVQATYMQKDWFGSEPLYGGYSAIRRREQSSSLKLFLPIGYLLFTESDLYEFKPKGGEAGSVKLGAIWGGSFGQVSLQFKDKRGKGKGVQGRSETTVSLLVNKLSLSYTEGEYAIGLTDSIPIGKGVGTWNLEKKSGEHVKLSLLYTLTSDL